MRVTNLWLENPSEMCEGVERGGYLGDVAVIMEPMDGLRDKLLVDFDEKCCMEADGRGTLPTFSPKGTPKSASPLPLLVRSFLIDSRLRARPLDILSDYIGIGRKMSESREWISMFGVVLAGVVSVY